MTVSDIVASITAAVVVPVVGWVVRLESKQAALETQIGADKELFESKIDSLNQTIGRFERNMDQRLERIEKSLNGHLWRDDEH